MSSSNVRAAAAAAVAVDWTVATLIIIIRLAARKNKINHNPVCLQKSQVHTHVCMSIVEYFWPCN
jgi:membrane protein CcdC involved in cytochrome C biogenesis